MNIPEEAIEAAARASHQIMDGHNAAEWESQHPAMREAYLADASVQIEAAAPFIAAQALRARKEKP